MPRPRPDESRHVAIAQRFFELGQQGDWSRLELLAPGVVYSPIAEITETGDYHGREGFRAYMEGFFDGEWAGDLSVEALSYREYGDAVIARLAISVRGRTSGLELAGRVYQVFTFENGEIVRIEDFLEREDALRAAGA